MTPKARFEIKVTLETAAAFSDAPAMGNAIETLGYIPGSALRGMLATLYLAKKSPDQEFRRLFVDGAVYFPDLYLANGRRLPFSAFSCKQHPGFLQDEIPAFMAPPHRVLDRLWEDFLHEPLRNCPLAECNQPLTPLSATCYSGIDVFKSVKPTRLTRMSTAVVASSGSARQGSLHSQQELAASQEFYGYLRLNPQDFDILKKELGENFYGYLGRKRSGRVKVSLAERNLGWDEPNIVISSTRFGRAYAALTCTSDLILLDDLLQPLSTLINSQLESTGPPIS